MAPQDTCLSWQVACSILRWRPQFYPLRAGYKEGDPPPGPPRDSPGAVPVPGVPPLLGDTALLPVSPCQGSFSLSFKRTNPPSKQRKTVLPAEEAGSRRSLAAQLLGRPQDGVRGPVQFPGHRERRTGLQQGGHAQGRVVRTGRMGPPWDREAKNQGPRTVPAPPKMSPSSLWGPGPASPGAGTRHLGSGAVMIPPVGPRCGSTETFAWCLAGVPREEFEKTVAKTRGAWGGEGSEGRQRKSWGSNGCTLPAG